MSFHKPYYTYGTQEKEEEEEGEGEGEGEKKQLSPFERSRLPCGNLNWQQNMSHLSSFLHDVPVDMGISTMWDPEIAKLAVSSSNYGL